MKTSLVACLVMSAVAAWAVPTADNVKMERTGEWVTVSYDLRGAPAVVTLDVQTNSVSIGREMIGTPTGKGHVLLTEDGTYTMKWSTAALSAAGVKELNDATAVLTVWGKNRLPDYLVCDLTGKDVPRYYVDEADLPGGQGVAHLLYKTEKLLLKYIQAKDVLWVKGAATNEVGFVGWNLEKKDAAGQKLANFGGEPPCLIRLTKNYYMGVYEVTQSQYERVTGTNPSYFTNETYRATRPVEKVSYVALRQSGEAYWPVGGYETPGTGAIQTFRNVTKLDRIDLPTEAQWEFACRAGTSMPYSFGGTISGSAASDSGETAYYYHAELEQHARYAVNACENNGAGVSVNPPGDVTTERGTAAVGTYPPNAFGLYDMHGNVFEWCLDWCNKWPIQEPGTILVDPDGGPKSESLLSTRVMKGGSYRSAPRAMRSAARRFNGTSGDAANFGFRLCWTVE